MGHLFVFLRAAQGKAGRSASGEGTKVEPPVQNHGAVCTDPPREKTDRSCSLNFHRCASYTIDQTRVWLCTNPRTDDQILDVQV